MDRPWECLRPFRYSANRAILRTSIQRKVRNDDPGVHEDCWVHVACPRSTRIRCRGGLACNIRIEVATLAAGSGGRARPHGDIRLTWALDRWGWGNGGVRAGSRRRPSRLGAARRADGTGVETPPTDSKVSDRNRSRMAFRTFASCLSIRVTQSLLRGGQAEIVTGPPS